jgi:hypothetical protein
MISKLRIRRAKLKVRRVKEGDVRKGWIRVHEDERECIKNNSLVQIKYCGKTNCKGKKLFRLIRGHGLDYDEKDKKCIFLDEQTREALGISDKQIVKDGKNGEDKQEGEELDFEIKEVHLINSICFYLRHPDNIQKFAITISLGLGFISIGLGLLSLQQPNLGFILSILELIFQWGLIGLICIALGIFFLLFGLFTKD